MDKQTWESVRDSIVQYPMYAVVDDWLRPVAWWAAVSAAGWLITWWQRWRWQREFRGAAIALTTLTFILALLTSRPNNQSKPGQTLGYVNDIDTGEVRSGPAPASPTPQPRVFGAGETEYFLAGFLTLPGLAIFGSSRRLRT